MLRILFLFIALLVAFSGYSQCFQIPVSIQERAAEADIIVESTLDTSYCIWNPDHSVILTVNRIKVYKYFKGSTPSQFLDVVTLGGELDEQLHVIEPELHLTKGKTGVLFIKENNDRYTSGGSGNYIPVAAEQGFIEYDMISKTASDPFEQYTSITNSLYPLLIQTLGQNFTIVNTLNFNTRPLYRITATPTITSFSPTTVTAGTNTTLTIDGTNFGATYSGSANVEFKDANNGGTGYISVLANQIVSWSDNQIQVKVRTQAGTGTIRVTNATAEQVVSASSLTVTYNQSNVSFGGVHYEPNLINSNAAGGYTYTYSTATANNGVSFDADVNAKARFASALSTWNCNTGFNVGISGSNTALGSPVSDGTNVVMYDNDVAPLPAGVLGRASSFYSGCSGGTLWYVNDIDIVFRRDGFGVTWYYGADPLAQPGGTSDFETVALHEIGHHHQLGHIISSGAVMHFSITTGTNNRSLNSARDIAGGLFVMGHSNSFASCSKTGMTNFSCTNPPVADFSASATTMCNPGGSINFTDLSSNAPTSWSWTFTGGSPATSTSQNPANIVYNTSGTYTVELTATNANGSDVETKTSYITVGGAAVPVTTDFEGTFAPAGFTVINPDGLIGFVQSGNVTGITGALTKAAYVNNYNYSFVATDGLQTFKYDLTSGTAADLKFDLAYERYTSANSERLQILISTDCGSTFPTMIYNKSGNDADGNNLSTTPATGLEFFPSAAAQWRRETVDLTPYLGSIIMLRFNVINGYGNNIYIDNININISGLPVILESFNAVKGGSSVRLNWSTIENDKTEIYKVERSYDGVYFAEILSVSSVKGKKFYEVTDYTPGTGLVYYRLKQTHENASLNYSPVVAVDMSSGFLSSDLILFPNPVESGQTFSFESQENETGDLKLFDLSGKIVGGLSFVRKGSFIEVSANVSAGVYILEYISEGLIRKGKIMVK
jgi:PKD repeat protein